MRVEDPYPVDVRAVKLREEPRKRLLRSNVRAVGSRVLGDEIDLPDSRPDEVIDLAADRLRITASESSPDRRDHAVGASVVASLGDLHVRDVVGCAENARCRVVVEEDRLVHGGDGPSGANRFDSSGDPVNIGASDNSVDTGQHRKDIFTVALGQATRDEDATEASITLEFKASGHHIGRFLHGRRDEGAGVDDGKVGAVRAGDERVTGLIEQSEHDFGIDEVLGASERYEGYLHGGSRRGGHEPRSP